jgi:hypothetical protein
MKYLMLIYGNEQIWGSLGPEEFPQLVAKVDAYNQALRDSGELVMVEGLVTRPHAFRRQDGELVASDGPYLEAKEHVGSMTVIDVDSEERALQIAASYPGVDFAADGGGLELWPLMEHGCGTDA